MVQWLIIGTYYIYIHYTYIIYDIVYIYIHYTYIIYDIVYIYIYIIHTLYMILYYIILYIYMVGGCNPLKNMSSSVGTMTFPIYGKIKFMFQTTNQIYIYIYCNAKYGGFLNIYNTLLLYHHFSMVWICLDIDKFLVSLWLGNSIRSSLA